MIIIHLVYLLTIILSLGTPLAMNLYYSLQMYLFETTHQFISFSFFVFNMRQELRYTPCYLREKTAAHVTTALLLLLFFNKFLSFIEVKL